MSDISFTFFDHPSNTALNEAWKKSVTVHLSPEDQSLVTVLARPFEDISGDEADFDCLVSPANSYGIMDGGYAYHLNKSCSR